MKAPFAWEDWYMSIACAVLFVPFLLLLIYLVKRIRDNKPIIRKVKVEPKTAATSVGYAGNRTYQR